MRAAGLAYLLVALLAGGLGADQSNRTAVRSSLRAALVSTVLAIPVRYSLCQITNMETNKTSVYAVGDTLMGARIHAIEKERVLVDHKGRREYIDRKDSSIGRSAATYQLIPSGTLPELEASSPQG